MCVVALNLHDSMHEAVVHSQHVSLSWSDLHEMVQSRKKQAFYQVYTNLPREKVDLGTRWNDLIKERGSSETLLYA